MKMYHIVTRRRPRKAVDDV